MFTGHRGSFAAPSPQLRLSERASPACHAAAAHTRGPRPARAGRSAQAGHGGGGMRGGAGRGDLASSSNLPNAVVRAQTDPLRDWSVLLLLLRQCPLRVESLVRRLLAAGGGGRAGRTLRPKRGRRGSGMPRWAVADARAHHFARRRGTTTSFAVRPSRCLDSSGFCVSPQTREMVRPTQIRPPPAPRARVTPPPRRPVCALRHPGAAPSREPRVADRRGGAIRCAGERRASHARARRRCVSTSAHSAHRADEGGEARGRGRD